MLRAFLFIACLLCREFDIGTFLMCCLRSIAMKWVRWVRYKPIIIMRMWHFFMMMMVKAILNLLLMKRHMLSASFFIACWLCRHVNIATFLMFCHRQVVRAILCGANKFAVSSRFTNMVLFLSIK